MVWLQVFYRNATDGSALEMVIPECGNPCHLDKLEEAVRDLLISDYEWKKECKNVDGWISWFFKPFTFFFPS